MDRRVGEVFNSPSNNPLIITAGVESENPLVPGSGNYLSVEFDGPSGAGANRLARVSRNYGEHGAFDPTAKHSVSFLLRYDALTGSWGEANNTMFVMDGSGAFPGNSTWAVSAYGDSLSSLQWAFSSGAGYNASTGIPLSTEDHPRVMSNVYLLVGAVYSFDIEVDPGQQQYRVSVENLNFDILENPGDASFVSDWLPFAADVDEVFGIISIGVRRNSDGTSTIFSFDQLRIVPEPASVALAFGAFVGLLALSRRRRGK